MTRINQDPSPIRRFSSRRQRLDRSFLAERLGNALAYDRIAGYFCSSILETAGESLETVRSPVRMVCNSGLQPQDVTTARAAAAALAPGVVRVAARGTGRHGRRGGEVPLEASVRFPQQREAPGQGPAGQALRADPWEGGGHYAGRRLQDGLPGQRERVPGGLDAKLRVAVGRSVGGSGGLGPGRVRRPVDAPRGGAACRFRRRRHRAAQPSRSHCVGRGLGRNPC